MRYRTLGRTGLEVSAIGLGGNRFAESQNTDEVRATFDMALDRGVNLIDLADCYGRGECERLVGRWIRRRRDAVILCSKVGARPALSVRVDRWVDPIRRWFPSRPERHTASNRPRPMENFSPNILRSGILGSLRRLRTDHLDVFYLHGPPPGVVADGAVFEALEGEKRAGRILHYGVSLSGSATTEEVLACVDQPGLSIVQVRVNTASTVDLERIETRARDAGVAMVAREVFLKGRLLDRYAAASDPVQGRAPAQVLLQAVLQRQGVDAVLVGTTRRDHLEENLAAVEATPLSEPEMAELWRSADVL
ncbi:MAG: aldo/keto reductase [Acidobacteriota bacterium]